MSQAATVVSGNASIAEPVSRPVCPGPARGPAAVGRRLAARALAPEVRNGCVVVFDQGLCSVTNFTCGVLVARSCSQGEYGLYVLGLSVIVTFQIIMRSLVAVPFTIYSPRLNRGEMAEYFGSTLVQELGMSAVAAAAVAAIAAILVATGVAPRSAAVLTAVPVALFCVALRDFMRSALLAQLKIWASLAMGAAANVATLVLLFWAYAQGRLSVGRAFTTLAICSGLAGFIVLAIRRRGLSVVPRRLAADIRKNWHRGRWTLATVLTNSLGIRAMPWLVLLWCGSGAVGVLGAALAVAGIVSPLVTGVGGYLTPKLAHDYHARGPAAAAAGGITIVKGIAIAAGLYVVVMAVGGNSLARLLYASRYQGHLAVLAVLALAVAFEAATVPLRSLLRVMGRPRTEFRGTLAGFVLCLVLSACLIPTLAVLGASIAVAASRMATFLVALAGVRYRSAPVSELAQNLGQGR